VAPLLREKTVAHGDWFCAPRFSRVLSYQCKQIHWETRSDLPPIISAHSLSKRYGLHPLFQNITFNVSDGDRIGLIGPNGSGKSTLLEILAGYVRPDTGEVALRKRARMARVAQVSEFAPRVTVRSVIEDSFGEAGVPEVEHASRFAETLGRADDQHDQRVEHGLEENRLNERSTAKAVDQLDLVRHQHGLRPVFGEPLADLARVVIVEQQQWQRVLARRPVKPKGLR